uniref:protein-tyrosine-phosphatase n=1 Tax=Hirondellea gigas TaxID=1518452 RepID=A0A2P2I968_9CRUS
MTQLSHVEAIEKELKQIESSNAWNQVYQKVRSDGTYDFALAEARSAINRPLNRYRDVLPYDHSRIILQHPTTDYINASLVKVESIRRQYILTQGPLSSTSQHFWLMVWQQQCKGIVMLNKIIEKNMIKCHQYWPLGEKNNGDDTISYPGVGLSVTLVSEVKHHHYYHRTLRLTETSSNKSREIQHFHYTTWPDFGVPQSPEALNKFLGIVIKNGCLDPDVGPAIVHCSAGIGRSGTFCLVDTILVMLERGLCSNQVGKVLEVLLDMRRYRMGLIQTPDQLRFSYQAIVHAARQRLSPLQNSNNKTLVSYASHSAAAAANALAIYERNAAALFNYSSAGAIDHSSLLFYDDSNVVSYMDKWGCVFTGLQITLHQFIDPRVVAGTI